LTDVFAIQDEIAAAIAGALQVKLSVELAARWRHEPNPAAHEAYLKAPYHWGRAKPESMPRCKEYLEQAIGLDPEFALAHCGYAEYFLMLAYSYLPAHEAMPRVREKYGKRWRLILRCRRRMPCWASWLEFMTSTGRKPNGVSAWRWLATLSCAAFANGTVSIICG
jgi:hypothetical protein